MDKPSADDAAVFAAFVIADIRGYTRFTREQGDSAAARLTRRLADLADDAIEARGGRVYELRGDEVACVFDSAAQAVRGALDLLALCAEEQAKDPSLPLAVGAGVDAGPTVPVGDGYRGSALNTAARLCSQAAAGQVLVSDSVSAMLGVHDDVTVQGRGEAVLKGFDDPMNLTEVTWRNSPQEGFAEPDPDRASVPPPAAIGWETASTLVGREHELRWLRGTWWQARRGRGRLVVVDGAHQMGKTRLVAQLAELVGERGEDVVYVGLGGTAAADAGRALDRATTATEPLLVILDDVDGLGKAMVPRVLDVTAQISDRPVLVVCTTTSVTSVPTLWAARGQFDEHEDGHRSLASLTAADVRAIGTEYVGSDVDELPVDAVLASTHGVPGQVHEVISAWAAGEASRRLAAAGEWLSSGRSRHSDDLTFANNVIARRLERIYASDDALDLGPDSCPYMGLASFGAEDAGIFFGREQLVGELAARTVGSGLLAVVGPSGAGKSSVIAAGLVPSLHAGLLPGSSHWRSVSLRPGGHPVDALLDALARPSLEVESSRTIVVIDQFEEIFTHGVDESARATFINAIVDLAHDMEHYVVVLGIRGDHYAHAAPYKELATLMADNTVLVGPMSREELRRAIEWPARRTAVRIEAQLVDALVEDSLHQAGGLPLLSTSLVELWSGRDGGWLRMRQYEQTGGVDGAVARLAERSYSQLTREEQQTARSVLLRLVVTDDPENPTRRRVPIDEFELDSHPQTSTVIARLSEDRLLTLDGTSVEVAHEALLREWPRMRAWMADDAVGLQLSHQLTTASTQWNESGRGTGDLYRDERLAAAWQWSTSHPGELNAVERDFLSASQRAGQRSARRWRSAVAILAVLLLASVIGGGTAVVQRHDARTSARRAQQETQRAIAQRVGVQATTEPDMSRALLLAAEGYQLDPSPQTSATLSAALSRAGGAERVFHASARLQSEALSPDGRLLACVGDDSLVRIFDTATGNLVGAPISPPKGIEIPTMSFSADGRSLILFASAHGHGKLALVDLSSRTVRATLRTAPPNTSISSVAASSDGHRIVTVVTTGQGKATTAALQQWELPGLQRLPGSHRVSPATTLRPRPDGTVLATSPKDVSVWGPQLDQPLRTYPVPAPISGLSDDGGTVAAVDGARVRLLDLATGSVTNVPSVKSAPFWGLVVFTPDKSSLAGTGPHGTVRLLDLTSGSLTVIGHESELRADVVGSGDAVYTVSLDRTAVRWGLSGGRFAPHFTVAPNGDGTDELAVSAQGLAATVAGPYNQSATLWDLATHKAVGSPMSAGPGSVGWVAFSPDGRDLAIVNGQDGNVAIWDVESGRQVATLHQAHPQSAYALAWSPNGRLIATGSIEMKNNITYLHGHVTVWDVASRHVVDRWAQPDDAGISTVVFDDSGTELASVGEGGTVALFDVADHSLARTWHTSDDFTFSAAYQPGTTTIATGGAGGGLVTLWNSSTGQAIPPPISSSDITAPVGYVNNGTEVVVARAQTDCHCTGSVQVWNVEARQLVANLPVGGGFPGTAVVPGSDDVVTTSSDGRLTTWHMSPTEWASDACAIANRNLTHAEWQTYLGDLPYEATCP